MGDDSYSYSIKLNVPFPTQRLAQIAFDVLRVDKEPTRSGVHKELSVKDCVLQIYLKAELARQLRVSVTGLFDKIDLIIETFSALGDPVGDSYMHY